VGYFLLILCQRAILTFHLFALYTCAFYSSFWQLKILYDRMDLLCYILDRFALQSHKKRRRNIQNKIESISLENIKLARSDDLYFGYHFRSLRTLRTFLSGFWNDGHINQIRELFLDNNNEYLAAVHHSHFRLLCQLRSFTFGDNQRFSTDWMHANLYCICTQLFVLYS
jgi:hypothetical protein